MPLKWKIFFALNFVLSIPALVSFIFLFISLLNSYSRNSDYILALVCLFGLLIITVNGFLNIYLLQRFFPDKLMPRAIKQVNTLSVILNIPLSIALLVLCIYGATQEFGHEHEGRDTTGKMLVAIFFLLWLVQVIILIMQGQLPGLISRNNRESMHSLIDSIGQ